MSITFVKKKKKNSFFLSKYISNDTQNMNL